MGRHLGGHTGGHRDRCRGRHTAELQVGTWVGIGEDRGRHTADIWEGTRVGIGAGAGTGTLQTYGWAQGKAQLDSSFSLVTHLKVMFHSN